MPSHLEMDVRDFQLESNAGGIDGRWVIHPQNRFYKVWMAVISLCCLHSYFNKLLEFGFPMTVGALPVVERVLEILFIADIVVQFFVCYFDQRTGHVISMHGSIAQRYLKFKFSIDVVACIPWETISKASGVPIGYLAWSRIFRLFKVHDFFKQLERDVEMNYFFTRLTKVILVGLVWVHTAACWLYFLATSVPPGQESNTWIGSLNLGGDYKNFKEFGFLKLYITSLYFSTITVTTVGYGDIHAVNLREMAFIISYVISGMIVSAYQLGNLTILIANGSRTSEMRNDIADLVSYMTRNGLSREICTCVKQQLQLQYARSYNEAAMFKDILVSIRSQIFRMLYMDETKKIFLFNGCSPEFINRIASRLHEELFLPGEVIMDSEDVTDNLYFVCYGVLEEVDTRQYIVSRLKKHDYFGEFSIFYHAPQPHTIKVRELSRVLRIDKQSIVSILDTYPIDKFQVLKNLEVKESRCPERIAALIKDFKEKRATELIFRMNTAAYDGDFPEIEALIKAGADPYKTDYNGRSILHIASARGDAIFVKKLIDASIANINGKDKYGHTPLLEAAKNGHTEAAGLLRINGAMLSMDVAGSVLCAAVASNKYEVVKLMLTTGCEPNCQNYDGQTPLHFAASRGLIEIAKLLVDFGADSHIIDSWGNTPLSVAERLGNNGWIRNIKRGKFVTLK